MSIQYRKTKKGMMTTVVYRDSSGRQRRSTLGPKTEWPKRRALAEENKLKTSSQATDDFKTVSLRWFEQTGKRQQWKPRTKSAYKRSLERLESFDRMRIGEVRSRHVAQFIEKHSKEYAGKTVNFDVSVLYAVFEYAKAHEMVDSNPAARAPRPKNGKRKWRILTPEEIQAVDKAFDDVEFETERERKQARLMFRVLTRTGIRRHELRQLRVKDFDPDKKTLRIVDSKTEEGIRSIALSDWLSEQLKEWLSGWEQGARHSPTSLEKPIPVGQVSHPESYIFQSSRGNQVGGQWYTDKFNDALKEAGITDYVRPFHDMRHTALTIMATDAREIPLMTVAGHKSMATTKQYLHLAGTVFPEVAAQLEARLNGG